MTSLCPPPLASSTTSSSHFQTVEWRFHQKSCRKSKVIPHHNPSWNQRTAAHYSSGPVLPYTIAGIWSRYTRYEDGCGSVATAGCNNRWLKGWRFKSRLQLLHMSEVPLKSTLCYLIDCCCFFRFVMGQVHLVRNFCIFYVDFHQFYNDLFTITCKCCTNV